LCSGGVDFRGGRKLDSMNDRDPDLIEIYRYWRQLYDCLGADLSARPGELLNNALRSEDPHTRVTAETLVKLLSEATIGRAAKRIAGQPT
jgi:hypothetical protein